MNKPNNFYWIGYYFGLNCILHPDTGRWTLTGYFDGQVVCHRESKSLPEIKISENEAIKDIDEMPDEDCLMCPIEDVQFILKKINPFLFASMHKFEFFIRTKAMEGYWMNFDEKSVRVIYEQ